MNTHDTLREEYDKKFLKFGNKNHYEILEFWLSKFSTHDQELLKQYIQEISGLKADNAYLVNSMEELIEAIGEDAKLYRKDYGSDEAFENMLVRTRGINRERTRIKSLLTSRLSNIKKK